MPITGRCHSVICLHKNRSYLSPWGADWRIVGVVLTLSKRCFGSRRSFGRDASAAMACLLLLNAHDVSANIYAIRLTSNLMSHPDNSIIAKPVRDWTISPRRNSTVCSDKTCQLISGLSDPVRVEIIANLFC